MKQAKAVAFALLICLLLSGCGVSAPPAPTESEAAEPSETAEYHVEYSKLPGNMLMTVSQYCDGENIYFCGMNAGNKAVLYRYDGKRYQHYAIPAGISYLYACCVCGDDLAALTGDYPVWWMDAQKNVHENQQEQYALQLLVYNKQGQLRETIPLDEEMQNGANYLSVLFTDGYFYILSEADLFQVSAAGALVGRRHLESGQFVSQLLTPEGLVLALYGSEQDDGGNEARIERLTSAAELSFETLYADPDGFVSGLGLTAEGELLFLTEGAIQRLPEGEKDATLFFDFRENGVYASPYVIVQPWDQAFLLIGRYQTGLDQLINGPLPEVEELVVWANNYYFVPRRLIEDFNSSNSCYRIRVETVDPDAPGTRARILSGDGPDLFYTGFSGIASFFHVLQNDSVFEDLTPYIAQSETVELLPVVQDAVMDGEKLFLLPINFFMDVMTCVHPELFAGEISLAQAMELPEVKAGSVRLVTKECLRPVMWQWLSNMYLASHVDVESGVCSFDTEEYIDLLRGCMMANDDETAMEDEDPFIFYHDGVSCPECLLRWQEYLNNHFDYLSQLGSSLGIPLALSMAKGSAHKEGAWCFMEYVFSNYDPTRDDADHTLPASRPNLERLLEAGKTTGFWDGGREQYVLLEPETEAHFRRLLDIPAFSGSQHPALQMIMREEAEKFFAGARSAEETAAATQSRAAIYVAEHFG